jgi:hypothetical protein
MKRLAIGLGVLAALAAFVLGGTDPGTSTGKAAKSRAAAKIVLDVLRREANEPIADRVELLKPALELAPKYEPVMWLSGFVFDTRQRQWLRYDEVPASVKSDKTMAAYLATRSRHPDTVDGQIDLARWCLKRNLPDQARAHLTRVLEMNGDQPEARRLLGQRQVAGNWLDESEINKVEAEVQKQLAALRKWKSRLEKINTNLDRGKRQSDAARKELMAISDPEAAVAIEVILCANGGDKALTGIEALKKLKGREPAASLTRLALLGGWEQIGREAARALGLQNMHDYVPQLLSLMQSPVQSRAEIYGSFANGTLLYRHAFYRERQDQKELAVLDAPYRHVFTNQTEISGRPGPSTPGNRRADALAARVGDMVKRKMAMQQFQADAMQKAAVREAALVRYNMTVEAMNKRICDILSEATAESNLDNTTKDANETTVPYAGGAKTPSQWTQWWNDYNEVYVPPAPVQTAYVSERIKTLVSEATRPAYASPPQQTTRTTTSTSSSPRSAPPVAVTSPSFPILRLECLAGDTTVWSETGPVNIKDVNIGDRVLACDVETGCLALKPVLRKTIRPKENTGELATITADGKTIRASGGHVFWVAGEGWIKARDLKSGMRLHTMKGTANVDSVGTSAPQETYNLIVADFHTFFAGDQISLTHDNTIRRPTNMVVPRLSRQEQAE